jgi:hypothetical protein
VTATATMQIICPLDILACNAYVFIS